ncbi:hypothetical protein WJR50_03800 [Catalinimonas sp. 4WD22]|uniref:hypothetical protein n=1 Tax=Catalinimonas locisalis TaxID=3133978 RepID=UPI003101B2D1
MIKKITLIALPVLALIVLAYYLLGGFNQIEIQKVKVEGYHLAGHFYEGPFKEDELKSYFFQMQDYVKNNELQGTVGVVNYDTKQAAEDSIRQFIGVILDENNQQIPSGLNQEKVPAQEALRAVIRAHPIVMPNPVQVVEQLRSRAKDEEISLKEFSIEQYIGEQEIWVDIPLEIVKN